MFILYTVPGVRGSLADDERHINIIRYTWPKSPGELQDIMTSTDGHTHRSTLPKGKMRPEVWARQKELGRKILHPLIFEFVDKITEPFVSVVSSHCSEQAAFLGNRLFLIGDALVQCQPNNAQSTNMAAFGATTLVDAICRANTLDTAQEKAVVFRDWERTMLTEGELSRRMSVLYGNFFLCGWGGAILYLLRYITCLIKVTSKH